jgi:hypothetical protein
MFCGKPIEVSVVQETLLLEDRAALAQQVTGSVPSLEKDLNRLSLAIALLSMVAHASPQDRGVYDNAPCERLSALLQNQ